MGAVRASLADMLALDRALEEGRLLRPESRAEMRAAIAVAEQKPADALASSDEAARWWKQAGRHRTRGAGRT